MNYCFYCKNLIGKFYLMFLFYFYEFDNISCLNLYFIIKLIIVVGKFLISHY